MKISKAALVIWRKKYFSKQFFVSINASDILSPKAILLIVRLSFHFFLLGLQEIFYIYRSHFRVRNTIIINKYLANNNSIIVNK